MRLPIDHLFLALLIGGLGWFISGDIYCITSALIARWCIDADHICDFLLYTIQSKKLNLTFIGNGQYIKIKNRIIGLLHSWELSFLLLLLGIFTPEYRATLISTAIAHAAHSSHDQRTYWVRILGHPLISRMKQGFAYKGFCRVGND